MESGKPFTSLNIQPESICQQICNEVFGDKCIFFIYDRVNQLCDLYDYDEQNYVATCTRFGGTTNSTLAECQNSTDPCLVRNGILLPKFFWPTVRKSCSSDRNKLLKFQAEGREFAKILRSLEQFIQTEKGQNNFW